MLKQKNKDFRGIIKLNNEVIDYIKNIGRLLGCDNSNNGKIKYVFEVQDISVQAVALYLMKPKLKRLNFGYNINRSFKGKLKF